MMLTVTQTAPPLARCSIRGCAWRWRSGVPRVCPLHGADIAELAERVGTLMDAPGNGKAEAAAGTKAETRKKTRPPRTAPATPARRVTPRAAR